MTLAERQARYRAAHAADTAATVKPRYHRPADRRSSHAAVRRKHSRMASKLPLSARGSPQQSSTFSIIF